MLGGSANNDFKKGCAVFGGLVEAFEKVSKAAEKAAANAVKVLRELFTTYRMLSKPDQDFPVLFPNTLAHPQPKQRPGVSADRRQGRGFRSLSERSNRRKAKRKSQRSSGGNPRLASNRGK